MKQEIADILRTPLEDVMHNCFMPYAEYVIMERALPRVEDGLKPVQRRILFSMHEMNITPDSSYKKCARIVGDTMGKYHPHGDTSIYDALVRMAQDFSMSAPLIDGHGNFGSTDGDGPAAMRYTEARLSPIAMEMLRDLEKETVSFHLNFDDSLQEPDMLPARYPNLLVNGATGIAVGLATNIPPHNLGEVIDGTVYRMKHADCTLDEIMHCIKSPDFPTGGSIHGKDELKKAYETGRGRITLRSKTEIETTKGGKTRIVVTELPYEVRESAMLKKIQSLRETRKDMFSGIDDVRSETDKSGIRAVIQLKKGTDPQKMLDCLFKYSDMQISYGVNMVAIADGKPKQMGLLEILDYYVAYQRQVVANRFRYDIEKAQEKEHKLAGLIAAVANLDLVVKTIRASKDSKEAKKNLMQLLDITGIQAQAILDLRLAKLTSLEIEILKKEYADVIKLLEYLTDVLASPEKLDDVICGELIEIKAKYGYKRRTKISADSGDIVIDAEEFKVVEPCTVIYTKGGNLKRMSEKAFSKGMEQSDVEERHTMQKVIQTTTDGRLQLFTDAGSLYTIPVASIKECKYKDAGSTIHSLLAGIGRDEKILSIAVPQSDGALITVSSSGLVKLTAMEEFVTRKSKIISCGLKAGDRLVLCEPSDPERPDLLLVTSKGMSIRFEKSEISIQGKNAKGVGGIRLSPGDHIVLASQVGSEGNVFVFSDAGFAKQTKISECEVQGRNGKGLKTFLWARGNANGARLCAAIYSVKPSVFRITTKSGSTTDISSADIPTDARYTRGTQIVPAVLGDDVVSVTVSD